METIEVPEYFICPISLQIMKDPVTAITGITYDRESIEHWLFSLKNSTCPLTKQPLPSDSDLTPNHMIRRLIQAWCMINASHGIDRIPTPKTPLNKFHVIKLVNDLENPNSQVKILRKLELLAKENERNRKHMVEANVPKVLFSLLVKCSTKCQCQGIEEILSILYTLRIPTSETKLILSENDQIIDSLMWVLCCHEFDNQVQVKSHAVLVLRRVVESSNSCSLKRVKPELFKQIIAVLNEGINQQGVNAALHIIFDACQKATNWIMIVESGAVYGLVELELGTPEKRNTELILGILFYLCSCADGRAQFLSHRGGIAGISDRILKVSPTVDDWAVMILSLICKFSGNTMVVREILKVGGVSKLCKLLQVDCAGCLKDRARNILRSISNELKDSPCFGVREISFNF